MSKQTKHKPGKHPPEEVEKHIVVAEPDKAVRALITLTLIDAGYRVTEVKTAEALMHYIGISKTRPLLIVVDNHIMADCREGLIELLKPVGDEHVVSVFVIAGTESHVTIEELYYLRLIHDHIRKPFSVKLFLHQVMECLKPVEKALEALETPEGSA